MTKISRFTGRYCHHTDRHDGLDTGNVLFTECRECGDVSIVQTLSPLSAAVMRTALLTGRTFGVALEMARSYDPRTLVYDDTHSKRRGGRPRGRGRETGSRTRRVSPRGEA